MAVCCGESSSGLHREAIIRLAIPRRDERTTMVTTLEGRAVSRPKLDWELDRASPFRSKLNGDRGNPFHPFQELNLGTTQLPARRAYSSESGRPSSYWHFAFISDKGVKFAGTFEGVNREPI